MCNPNLESFQQKLSELQAFITNDAEGLTADEQAELHELSDEVKSVWIKENAVFALTRITETAEKISDYKEYLEKGIEEYKLKSKKVDADAAASASTSPLSEDSVDSGDILPSTSKSPNVYEKGAGLSLFQDPNNYLAEVEAALEKSQDILDAQVPSSPVLQPEAYTYPQPENVTKQTRMLDSFDGGLSTWYSTRSDEADLPEVS